MHIVIYLSEFMSFLGSCEPAVVFQIFHVIPGVGAQRLTIVEFLSRLLGICDTLLLPLHPCHVVLHVAVCRTFFILWFL
jgi:hypothetical protein